MPVWIAGILKTLGITGLSDWILRKVVKVIKVKVLGAAVRWIRNEALGNLKAEAYEIGVGLSKELGKLSKRAHLNGKTAEEIEAAIFDVLASVEKGAKSHTN